MGYHIVNTRFEDMMMHDLVLLGKAFADPTRIRILAALRQGELCVCELCDAMEMSQSTLSTHLQIIRQASLVTTRRDGKWVNYGLEPDCLPLLETIFDRYKAALDADNRFRRDTERVRQRLSIRVDGKCTLSFGALETPKKGGDPA